MPSAQIDAIIDELAIVAGRIEREATLRLDAAIADIKRLDAEREVQFTRLMQDVRDRLASVKDGATGERGLDGKDGRDGIDGKDGAPGERGLDGKDGLPGERGTDGKDGRDGIDGKDGAPGERGLDGKDGLPGERGTDGKDGRDGIDGKDGAPGERGLDGKDGLPGERGLDGKDGRDGVDGKDGRLPAVKAWSDGVHYDGEVCAHAGATWQALRDTAKAPPHEDWICLAAGGRDGRDGGGFVIRGTFAEDVADYRSMDVVALGGASFVARRDNPGPCPGDGWQLLATQGKRGNAGDRGPKGDRGAAGPSVERMTVDTEGMLTLVNADGSSVTCDLYPVLTKLR